MGIRLAITLSVMLALPAQEVKFSGAWHRDAERSDDPQEKMQAAMEQMRGSRGDGPRGSGGGRARGEGRPDGEGRGGPEAGLARAATQLDIDLTDSEFHVDDGERLQIYYLDGEKHRRELASGAKIESVAELKGHAVLIEEKSERGDIERKFELSPDGETMVVTVTLKMGRMKDPVVIRSVYDRGETSEVEGSGS